MSTRIILTRGACRLQAIYDQPEMNAFPVNWADRADPPQNPRMLDSVGGAKYDPSLRPQTVFLPTWKIMKEKSGKRYPEGDHGASILGDIWEAFGRHLRSIWETYGQDLGRPSCQEWLREEGP